jgi:uncharacterized Fe-S radical SAM superfamily protein PflX
MSGGVPAAERARNFSITLAAPVFWTYCTLTCGYCCRNWATDFSQNGLGVPAPCGR